MAKKYYAVKTGYTPGIYETWDECKKQVGGFSGATYKSFKNLSEAEKYLGEDAHVEDEDDTVNKIEAEAVAYVDGSYEDSVKEFSYGIVMFVDGKEERFAEKFDTQSLVSMRNVAGEILGAEKAMRYCIDNNIKSLDLYYDYEGIEKWCTGAWKASKEGTKEYKEFFDSIKSKLKVNFYKVVAHTGDRYNELADRLAKEAIRGEFCMSKNNESNLIRGNCVFIDRTNIDAHILSIGKNEWGEMFNSNAIYQQGNQYRCDFSVDSVNESIDFYFRSDGKTTLKAVGCDTKYAPKLIELLKTIAYAGKTQNTNCTFTNITDDTYLKLIEYLSSIKKISKVEDREIPAPRHRHIKLTSDFGDTMVIKRYSTGKLLFQGTPAYILTEALSFMSMATEVSLDEIVERKNEAYQSDITVDKTREELRQRLPNTYDKLDDVIIKLLSPSIALSTSGIQVEDYSCYAFPALKALEALLLNLLSDKGILRPASNSFGSIFHKDENADKHKLNKNYVEQIDDKIYVECLEDIYNYFKGIRHTTFHANQILCLTVIIENKTEADTILNSVLSLFENVGSKLLK